MYYLVCNSSIKNVHLFFSPFFGEEFQFDIPREFRYLCVYVYDRDRPLKTDKVVGKVSIKREDLTKHNGKDQWLGVTPVDADSEVQVTSYQSLYCNTPYGTWENCVF